MSLTELPACAADLSKVERALPTHVDPKAAPLDPSQSATPRIQVDPSLGKTFAALLADPCRPTFTLGTVPPKQGSSENDMVETASKLTARDGSLEVDGWLVYDIQEEKGRTEEPRPFPFRKMSDPAQYGAVLQQVSGKASVIYKCAAEHDAATFDDWIGDCVHTHHHSALNLVGAPSSQRTDYVGPTMSSAAKTVQSTGASFGCVTIAERHRKKNDEHMNLQRKARLGAKWFISQAVFDADMTIQLIQDYAALCRETGETPRKIILTFAPCGRKKTLSFLRWLGVSVPEGVENTMFAMHPDKDQVVAASVDAICSMFQNILASTCGSSVPLGINVEAVSIFKEEVAATHVLFNRLQTMLLESHDSPFVVRCTRSGPCTTTSDACSEEHLSEHSPSSESVKSEEELSEHRH